MGSWLLVVGCSLFAVGCSLLGGWHCWGGWALPIGAGSSVLEAGQFPPYGSSGSTGLSTLPLPRSPAPPLPLSALALSWLHENARCRRSRGRISG